MSPVPEYVGRFERALTSGRPVVTCEISPADGGNPEEIRKRAKLVRDYVDAVNVPDNTGGMVHASPIACCAILAQEGVDPIVHMTCRDRNRLGLQSDLLGASLLGIRNVLCLTGDHPIHGDHPGAKPVYDLDSVQLIALANRIASGHFMSGREVKPPPDLFPGGAANPFAPPYEYRPLRLAKKIDAGAKFIQTQIVFNVQRFEEYMGRVHDLGLDKRIPILAGVAPIRSVNAAKFMRDEVPGMEVPEALVRRMEQAGEEKAKRESEGIDICVEIIEQVRRIPGVAGIHLMPIQWERSVAEISKRAHLAPAMGAPKLPPMPVAAASAAVPVPASAASLSLQSHG